jgi:lysyl-tRNA synthetase class 1
MANELRDIALASKAWPFEEARKLLARYRQGPPAKGQVLFETGYGPSGLPHIGTFNEVLRTTLVRRAFATLSDIPTHLIAFSDDMDGLRKVPDNVPNQAMLREHLGKPLTRIPDPFGTHESFAHHNNAMLRDFLDRYGFDYEFLSSTECYASGRFDEALRGVLRHYDAIMGVMLPTLREERRATYSPVLPVDPKTGIVLQVPVEVLDAEAGTIRWIDPNDGETIDRQRARRGIQAAMEGRLGDALGGARRRLRDGGQGSDRFGRPVVEDLPRARREAARGLQLRDVPRRKGREDLQVEGQWPQPRALADLRPAGEPCLLHLSRAEKGQALHMGVIPRAVDDYWQFRGGIMPRRS